MVMHYIGYLHVASIQIDRVSFKASFVTETTSSETVSSQWRSRLKLILSICVFACNVTLAD